MIVRRRLTGTGSARRRGVAGQEFVAGAVAALASGLVWAAISYYLQVEIGWLAIGVGALVGWAVAAAAKEPSPALGVSACALAVGGIVVGKLLAISWSFGAYAQVEYDDDLLMEATVHQMVIDGETSDAFKQWMLDPAAQEIPEPLAPDLAQHVQTAQQRLADASPQERSEIGSTYVQSMLGNVSFVDRLKEDFHPLDVLWYILAVVSAWGIASGGATKDQPAAAA